MELPDLLLHPIGIIRTPYIDRVDAPRQPGAGAESAAGKIILEAGHNFEQALEDLEGFEKIWIIYQFHRNTNWKPKVLPPRGDRTKRGVFATRSPHRPNPIGLSLVDLVDIDGRNIYVNGVDILDKSPVFDIKPYLPYAESFPDAKCGWLDEAMEKESKKEPLVFVISDLAKMQLEWLEKDHGITLLPIAERVLGSDPLPHPSKRIFKESDGGFAIAIKSWRIYYRIEGNTIFIDRVGSGYSSEALQSEDGTIHQKEAHVAFHKEWSFS
jgi:tRNA-Thr(GGU) m(6)t(6)A37 methyltransferase TsaA